MPIDAIAPHDRRAHGAGQQRPPPVTLSTTVDATNLVNLRQQFKAVAEADRGSGGRLYRHRGEADGAGARKHPLLNARWDGDRSWFRQPIHIGIAVDTDAGLLVPVIRDVPDLTLASSPPVRES